jgi:hypothetical protein
VYEHETTTSPERSVLGRRTILKGAAWSVPAVLAVGATPAFAVSNDLSVASEMSVSRTRKTVTYNLPISNPAPTGGTQITSIAVALSGVSASWSTSPPKDAFSAAVGTTSLAGQQGTTVTFTGKNQAANTNATYVFNFTINYQIAGTAYSQYFQVAAGTVEASGIWTRTNGAFAQTP